MTNTNNLQIGQKYWAAYYNHITGYEQIIQVTFVNDITDQKRKVEGRMFADKPSASKYLDNLRG